MVRPSTFAAFGVAVQVTVDDPALHPMVEQILPPGRIPCDRSDAAGQFGLRASGPDSYAVTVGGAPSIEYATLEVALRMLDSQVRMFIAANAPDLVFVHAGAVARDGRALVIPGESFTGKTTLVQALVEAGATYYSDEYAVLDADGRVHPYPRALSIRNDDGTTTRERHVGDFGGVAAEASAEVGVVLVTRYRANAEWQPERLSAGDGVVALLANTVPARERPRESLQALSRAMRGATVLQGDRGDARAVAPAMLKELAALLR
jgi:hypothetical protein